MKWAGTRNVCFFTWSYFLQLFDGVYFSFFNPLKVTDELEIESLGSVHGGELATGRNRYKPRETTKENTTILELP